MKQYRSTLLILFAGLLFVGRSLAQQPANKPPTTNSVGPADVVGRKAATLNATRTVVFKKVGDKELRLHLFEPTGWKPGDRRSCFVAVHGGGWDSGTPQRFYPFADHFAKLGMVGVSIQYSLMKDGKTPFDSVKDGRSAVRYLRSHAAELGIDPQKIIVSGGSAGGHVAAGTALFSGIDSETDDTTVSSIPNALVLYFPVIDTSADGYGQAKCGPNWQDISPLHQVKPHMPPTLVLHGTADTSTPFRGAKLFQEAMQKVGNRCELVTNEGGGHGYFFKNDELFDEAMKQTEAFLASLGFLDSARK